MNPIADTSLAALMQAERVPGCALAVVRDGQVSQSIALGVRSLAGGEPVDPQTVFARVRHQLTQVVDLLGVALSDCHYSRVIWES